MPLILLPFLGSGFVPTDSMPAGGALVRRVPAVHADHGDAARAADGHADRTARSSRSPGASRSRSAATCGRSGSTTATRRRSDGRATRRRRRCGVSAPRAARRAPMRSAGLGAASVLVLTAQPGLIGLSSTIRQLPSGCRRETIVPRPASSSARRSLTAVQRACVRARPSVSSFSTTSLRKLGSQRDRRLDRGADRVPAAHAPPLGRDDQRRVRPRRARRGRRGLRPLNAAASSAWASSGVRADMPEPSAMRHSRVRPSQDPGVLGADATIAWMAVASPERLRDDLVEAPAPRRRAA